MKKIKKMISAVLVTAMALAMSVTAFAEPQKMDQTGATYKIYQIFTGRVDDGVLSDVLWGQNGTGTKGEKVDKTVLEALEAVKDATSDNAKLDVIKQYANLTGTPFETTSETKFEKITPGYYLVQGTVSYAGTDPNGDRQEQGVESLYVVRVTEDGVLNFQPKVDVPTVDKKIVEGDDRVDNNDAAIGDIVNYEIVGTLPGNYAEYKSYFYRFDDTLSAGLTFQNDIKVEVVNGEERTDVTSQFYQGHDNGNIVVGVIDLKKVTGVTITAASQIVVTYSAELNDNAIIGAGGNPNDVKLTFSNNPNMDADGRPNDTTNPPEPDEEHPVGETPKFEVKTYTTEVAIQKVNQDGVSLAGAEFTLEGDGVKVNLVTETTFEAAEDGDYYKLANGKYTKAEPILEDVKDEAGNVTIKNNKADYDAESLANGTMYKLVTRVIKRGEGEGSTKIEKVTVDEAGLLIFTGLGEGKYTLTETKAPAGYNSLAAPIEFEITYADGKFSSEQLELENVNTLWTKVVNNKGSLLPSTGGIGTTIFYIVGAILIIGAGVILITKKRVNRA